MNDIHNRYRNALIGLAAGDAWGYQSEFTAYSSMDGPVRPPEDTWVISDDTQMTLALQDALETLRTAPGETLAEAETAICDKFIGWAYSPYNNRAPGNTCMGSIERLATGMRWPEAALESAGCGAVMRLLPTAMWPTSQWRALTALQAVMTHRHPLAVVSALILAECVRQAHVPGRSHVDAAIDINDAMALRSWAVGYIDPDLRAVLDEETTDIKAYLADGARELSPLLMAASEARIDVHADPCEEVGQGWDAGSATALALMIADAERAGALTPDQALQWAATSNGDSDSIAAMAGMLIGAASTEEDLWGEYGVSPQFEPVYHRAITAPEPWFVSDQVVTRL